MAFIVGILYSKNSRFMSFTSSFRIILFILTIFFSTISKADNKIIIASTTSTYDTGLLNLLNEEFYKKYEVRVQVLSLGTGQAIRTAKDGNAEILLVHHNTSMSKRMMLALLTLLYVIFFLSVSIHVVAISIPFLLLYPILQKQVQHQKTLGLNLSSFLDAA